jgi:hypothetical protein
MTHNWTFFRAGDLDQVLIKTADDFRHLADLDQKWWVALACPTKGLECDDRTLALIDRDKDNRVRVPELIEAVRWTCSLLKDPSELTKARDGLLASAIDDSSPLGKVVLASMLRALAYLNKGKDEPLTVAAIGDSEKLFATTRFNGDGVITPETCDLPELQNTVNDIMKIQGALADRSGKMGIDQVRADAFFLACNEFTQWADSGEKTLPLGDSTPAAYQSFIAVRSKINDYFSRCRLAAYDSRAAAALNRAEKDYLDFAAKDLSIATDEVVGLPLQRIEPNKPLHFAQALNPAWKDRVDQLRQLVIKPLFGEEKQLLEDATWGEIVARFAPYEAWLASKKGQTVEVLGLPRVREILSRGSQAAINSLITQDLALKDEVAGLEQVELLVRYNRDLYTILRNFVSFADLYDKGDWAIFQAGTLYMDQRACAMCVKVADPAAHMLLGSLAKIYIAYCQCTRGNEKIYIAACVTQGDGDFLMVGRNGIFYDRQGRDWDATVVKIIDNPVSVRQAFWSPYKKFVRFMEEQIAKRAATAEQNSEARLQQAATTTVDAAHQGKAPANKPTFEVGTVAALGVGLGAIGTLLGGAMTGFLNLGLWMPLGVLGIMLLISGPSMIIAAIKLRQRTLGPILEGAGWAINGRIKISMALGRALTDVRQFPAGSSRVLHDPFADKKSFKRNVIIVALVLLALLAGVCWQWRAITANWNQLMEPTPTAAEGTPPPADTPPPAPAK